jgi:hypothetical protein
MRRALKTNQTDVGDLKKIGGSTHSKVHVLK